MIIRTATVDDASAIHALIDANRTAGHLLPRDLANVRRRAGAFVVADFDGQVVGCAELAPLSPLVAEIRSLVVAPDLRGAGVATDLVAELRRRADTTGFDTLCAFTHDARFFVRQNFSIVPHLWVPQKIAKDCAPCPLFRRCGQHAMVLSLRATSRHAVADVPQHAAVA
ncbi:MAG: GNAT family N-acetyltransferase [Acidobacteria bacterium]|nr:GNAT family N-acetyltransferase [Acidobacteriota bacterium]